MIDPPNPIDVRVGENARYWREERGLTVLYVSTALGLGRDAFERMEAGAARFGIEDLQKLCGLLAIRPAALYQEVLAA